MIVEVGTTGVDRPSEPMVKPAGPDWIDVIADAITGVGKPSEP